VNKWFVVEEGTLRVTCKNRSEYALKVKTKFLTGATVKKIKQEDERESDLSPN
jgi:hypothetical protein